MIMTWRKCMIEQCERVHMHLHVRTLCHVTMVFCIEIHFDTVGRINAHAMVQHPLP